MHRAEKAERRAIEIVKRGGAEHERFLIARIDRNPSVAKAALARIAKAGHVRYPNGVVARLPIMF